MREIELMMSGHLYYADDKEINEKYKQAKQLIRMINKTTEKQWDYRVELLKKLFNKTGETLWIETPFQCDFGFNITLGDHFYANYDCIIIDACEVIIGNNVLLGPRVCIYTAGHPIDPDIRNLRLEYGKKVIIGNDVWIGGNTIITPGVEIGNNVVIGAGSVVTKNIPSNVVAVGNPCRVIRSITPEDKEYWQEHLYTRIRAKELNCELITI